jgi:hypothetical protein
MHVELELVETGRVPARDAAVASASTVAGPDPISGGGTTFEDGFASARWPVGALSVDASSPCICGWAAGRPTIGRPAGSLATRLRWPGPSLGGAAVLVYEATEHVDPLHSRRCRGRSNGGQRAGRNGWLQIEGAVWPGGVVVPQIFGEDRAQLSFVPDQRSVQTLAAHVRIHRSA